METDSRKWTEAEIKKFIWSIPSGCHWNYYDNDMTPGQIYWAVLHELDLVEEGEDAADMHPNTVRAVRRWLDKYKFLWNQD